MAKLSFSCLSSVCCEWSEAVAPAAGRLSTRGPAVRLASPPPRASQVQGAMTTELDYGIGNVTGALQAAGMFEQSVLILVSDARPSPAPCAWPPSLMASLPPS